MEAHLMYGVKLTTKIVETEPLTKYNENTGKPYKVRQSTEMTTIEGTDINIHDEKYEPLFEWGFLRNIEWGDPVLGHTFHTVERNTPVAIGDITQGSQCFAKIINQYFDPDVVVLLKEKAELILLMD